MTTTAAEFIPPMMNGVSASKVFLPLLTPVPPTLYAYLCQHFPHISASEWQQRFHDGLIYDQQGEKLKTSSPYLAQQHIFYYRFLAHEVTVPFAHEILYENDDLLVVDKPHFLTMSPTGQYVQQTLLVRLKHQTQNAELTPIHRLDRETAGVVLFSKRTQTRGIYQQMFATRQVSKTYHAIAPTHPTLIFPYTLKLRMDKGQPFYTMQVIEGEANSQTTLNVLEQRHGLTKYELKPHTGKQHQLRLHLSHLGIPILNDPFYSHVQHKADNDFSHPLQLLAKHLCFQDPITEQYFEFHSKLDLVLP